MTKNANKILIVSTIISLVSIFNPLYYFAYFLVTKFLGLYEETPAGSLYLPFPKIALFAGIIIAALLMVRAVNMSNKNSKPINTTIALVISLIMILALPMLLIWILYASLAYILLPALQGGFEGVMTIIVVGAFIWLVVFLYESVSKEGKTDKTQPKRQIKSIKRPHIVDQDGVIRLKRKK